jgi:hypothetical protein
LTPIDPNNLRRYNYGNNDADVRHYFSANYLWDDVVRRGFHRGPRVIFGDWTVGGTFFFRTGLPFSVQDTNASSVLAGTNFGNAFLATITQPGFQTCDKSAVDTPCFSTDKFAPPADNPSNFGNQTRNQFRGPNFFNADLQLTKNFTFREHYRLGIGAQFFNVFNHPNFDKPVADIADPNFGFIRSTVNSPTSIFGSFLGGDASPRLIQLRAQFTF